MYLATRVVFLLKAADSTRSTCVIDTYTCGHDRVHTFFITELDSKWLQSRLSHLYSQQLVTSVFRELWFTLPPEGVDQREALIRRVTNITAVVSRPVYRQSSLEFGDHIQTI